MATLSLKSGVLTWGIWLPCTSQQHVLIVFWQASAREDKSAILEMVSPGRDQDKSNRIVDSMLIVKTAWAASRERIQGAPFMEEFRGHLFDATPTQRHLSCKKQNQKVRITFEYTHAITHHKSKALIEGMRAMISYWLQQIQIKTPPET